MWAVAAQPRTGLTPMIPTPSVDPGIARNPSASSTRTTVMRSATISRLMMRTLFTALWMPYAAWARAFSSGKAYSLIRRRPSSRSDTIFCVPTTRMTRPAPLAYGPSAAIRPPAELAYGVCSDVGWRCEEEEQVYPRTRRKLPKPAHRSARDGHSRIGPWERGTLARCSKRVGGGDIEGPAAAAG